jgi:hypothetical protein
MSSAVAAFAGEMVPQARTNRPIKAVLELFTSQGCSSCPPADALFRKYAEAKDLMALSLPVDYWDYLGWKDTLASPKNSERQRWYARTLGTGSVYTPQMVINGKSHATGWNSSDIEAAINEHSKDLAENSPALRFWRHESIFYIEIGNRPSAAAARQYTVWFAVIQKRADVSVTRGENGGKTLTYFNIVREMVPVGVWEGSAKTLQLASASIIRPESEELGIIVQDNSNGEIIAATYLAE